MTRPALPWMVPVPLKAAPEFAPLFPEHAPFAVTTDLGAIGPYGLAGTGTNGPGPAAADLQSCLDVNAPGWLGAGRAVFYRGLYLKGMGRTQLAANWADANDTYHNTGHMFPSSAAREYAVSLLADRAGFAHAIVPCEGVLVRPLDPRLRGVLKQSLEKFYDQMQHRAADEGLQAITVKPGRFARLTNLSWLWNTVVHALEDPYVVTAARLSHAAFTGFQPVADSALDPAAIVAALEAAVGTAVDNFLTFIAKGVFWGSYHNNFTADGRFLDIELPTLTGGDFLGAAVVLPDAPDSCAWDVLKLNIGTELFQYLGEVRLFIRFWENRLRFLSDWGEFLLAEERRFCIDLADALRATFPAHSFAFNEDLVLDRLAGFYAARLGLTPEQRLAVEQLFREAYGAFFRHEAPHTLWAFRRTRVELPDSEPGLKLQLYYPAVLGDALDRPATPEQAAFGDLMHRVDREADPDAWLDRLREYHPAANPVPASAGTAGDSRHDRCTSLEPPHRHQPAGVDRAS